MSPVQHSWGQSAQLTAGRRTAVPRGKVAGGSTAIGSTVAVRGTPADYDEWASLGNQLWSWQHALPALTAIESDLDFGTDKYHSAVALLPIRRWRPEELSEVQQAFLDACLDSGHRWAPEQNYLESFGVGPIPSTRRDATTWVSMAKAPTCGRPWSAATWRTCPARGPTGSSTSTARCAVSKGSTSPTPR